MPDFNNLTWIYEWVYQFIFQLTLAITAPLTSTSDIYWAYLLSALVLGVGVTYRRRTLASKEHTESFQSIGFWRSFQSIYLSKKLWGHPSALLDMRYYVVNAIVFPLLFAPLALQSQTVDHFLKVWFEKIIQITPANILTSGSFEDIATKLVYTLVFFVAYDGGRFIAHSLLHDVKWLWEFHKIHHSAQVLTPFTTFRVHPVDLMVMVSVPALTTGIVTWLFHVTVSPEIGFYTLLNLHVFICLFNFIDNIRHWNVWVTYPAPLNKWFISPAHHQLHHSADPKHWGCNRGFELAIWDHLYKTAITPSVLEQDVKFGLGDGDDLSWRTIGQLYINPFKNLLIRGFTSTKQSY